MKWFGYLLCKLGWHKVRNKHCYSASAWSGPCVRSGCGITVTTPAYKKVQAALSQPDELCPHNCGIGACGKHKGEGK